MRISPDSTADLVASLGRTQRAQEIALEQISSGKRIRVASDDPAGMAEWIHNRSRSTHNDEFTHSAGTLKSMFQTADSALSSVVSALERAVGLGVRGANGSLSEADRRAIAQEVTGVRDNVLDLANVSLNGVFLFAGTNTRTSPFVLDTSESSGIRYDGNDGISSAPVGETRSLPMNVPGNQIFVTAGSDVFESLNQLEASLKSNDPAAISTATSKVRSAFDHVTAQRVFYGNAVAQLELQESYLADNKLELARQENQIAGIDQFEAISRFVNAQAAHDATLQAAGKVSRLSLLDYVR